MTHRDMRGFEYLVYSAFSSILLLVLLLLPLAPIFANEPIIDDFEIVTDSVSEQDIQALTSPEKEGNQYENTSEDSTLLTEVVSEEAVIENGTHNNVVQLPENDTLQEPSEILNVIYATTTTGEQLNETESKASTDGVTTEIEPVTEIETTSTEVETFDTAVVQEVVVTDVTELADVQIEIEPTPTTTIETGGIVNEVTNDENKYSFSKQECTTIGSGTFFCATAVSAPQTLHTDRVFSAVDAEGDKEIYVEKKGERTPLTDNSVDDDAPYFDEISNTAVWHRLIDGRFQIVQFDFDTGTELQLTSDSFNNMLPNIFGDALVWQGWVGNDWEIFFETKGKRIMLTDNATNDIAPSVNGTHIVWQSFENEAWRMKVYDIRTELTETINDVGGGSIENPRFVLVYDAKMETGDVETRGYDFKSGEVLDLASRPVSVPEEIPSPDQTGEDRALVAPSVQPKQKTDSDENDDVGTTTESGTGEGDLVIPALDDVIVVTNIASSINESDVVIPMLETSSTTAETEHIEDIVIEPYIPMNSIPTQSQNVIVGEE